MIRGYFFCILAIFLSTGITLAQTDCIFDIKGRIISAENGEPIPFATIEVTSGSDKKAIGSKADGLFELSSLCEAEVTILVKFIGFQTLQKKYALVRGENNIEIKLLVDVRNLGEVTVEEEKVAEIVTVQRSEVNAEALNRSAGASLGEALTEITGVNMLQTGPTIAKPVIPFC